MRMSVWMRVCGFSTSVWMRVWMRGLEPPPGFPDTDPNRAQIVSTRPPASRSSAFPDRSDASHDMTVAKLLPRHTVGGHGADDSPAARCWLSHRARRAI